MEIKQAKYWDNLSHHYIKYVENSYLQSFITLAIHTNAPEARTILEVGCGSGQHSLHFALTLLSQSSVLIASDISDALIEGAINRC